MENSYELGRRAEELLEEGTKNCRQLAENIPALEGTHDPEYKLVAGMMLMDSTILTGEIICALKNESLLLSLIGLRSLLEALINAAYIYAHPKHKGDIAWSSQVCKDYIERANNPKLMKQRLNEESVKERAVEVGLGSQYTDAYVSFCNFSHMLGFCPKQNNPLKTQLGYQAAFVQTVSAHFDIYQVISTHFKLKLSEEYQQKIDAFCKQYVVDFSKQ